MKWTTTKIEQGQCAEFPLDFIMDNQAIRSFVISNLNGTISEIIKADSIVIPTFPLLYTQVINYQNLLELAASNYPEGEGIIVIEGNQTGLGIINCYKVKT